IRLGTFSHWREEGFIRRFAETIAFLHHQAMVDQAYYILEIDFEKRQYSIGVMRAEEDVNRSLAHLSAGAGNLTLELAAFLNPSIGESQTIIPPPSYPSLSVPVTLPDDGIFLQIRTMRGLYNPQDGELPYVLFSPRGFSEFAVIQISLPTAGPITVLVNPFTGLAEVYRSLKDFEWTYGRQEKNQT
ncbi:MAG: hypothetical protein DCC75_11965, partial [Proteobacteria bacterium]